MKVMFEGESLAVDLETLDVVPTDGTEYLLVEGEEEEFFETLVKKFGAREVGKMLFELIRVRIGLKILANTSMII